jgi:hypothetical protein
MVASAMSTFHGRKSEDKVPWGVATTVILRNIPNNCTRARLLEEISRAGFANAYNFFYLPLDYETRANKGYAFLNFRQPAAATQFHITFHGQRLKDFRSYKVLVVEIASVQGFWANFDNFLFKNRMFTNLDSEFHPIFMYDDEYMNGKPLASNLDLGGYASAYMKTVPHQTNREPLLATAPPPGFTNLYPKAYSPASWSEDNDQDDLSSNTFSQDNQGLDSDNDALVHTPTSYTHLKSSSELDIANLGQVFMCRLSL